MRLRLIIVATTLVTALLLALMIPLLNAYAADRTQDLFVTRLGDATRFAVLAEDALESDSFGSLTIDVERYADVYGGTIIVVNANHLVVAASPGGVGAAGIGLGEVDDGDGDGDDDVGAGNSDAVPLDPLVSAAMDRALSGATPRQPPTAWPWNDEPFVLGSPVGRDAQVLGAVIMIAPTDSVRDDVGDRLLWLVVAGLAVLVSTAYGLIGLLVRWIIRPVHDLDGAAKRLAHGDLSTRVPERTGPPELRELASSFNVMADTVETSQRQQRDLIADASHQLGNPLTALRLRVENLGASDTSPSAEDVAKVLEESDRLNTIVDSLLDLSQVGAQRVATGPVDIAARARHRCDLWSPMFTSLQVTAPDTAVALATTTLVDVVLDALLDNAAKFAEGSPVEVTVSAGPGDSRRPPGSAAGPGRADGSAEPAGSFDAAGSAEARDLDADGGVVLRVRDHGPGLEAEDIEKVGARFFRGRQHQNIAGTGLGLAIVRARIQDIGGTFAVTVPPGGGLQVEVRFRSVPPGAGSSTSSAGASSTPTPAAHPRRSHPPRSPSASSPAETNPAEPSPGKPSSGGSSSP